MDYSRDPFDAADAASHPGRPEQYERTSDISSRTWRPPSLQSDYREGRVDPSKRSRHSGISLWLFMMATALNTLVAAFLAVIITLGTARQERTDNQQRKVTFASVNTRPAIGVESEPTQLSSAPQAIDLRPIGSPNQPLQLEAQKPARLPLQIQPAAAAREPFILVFFGAPVGTTLTGATRIGSDTWFLSPGSANWIEITLPDWSTSIFEITIALRRTNGLIAAQTKAWISVPPPASADAAGPKIDAVAAKDLLAKADRLIEKGDIVTARALYERAAEMGSGAAALALGATYDPNRLWSLGTLGAVGNKARAKQWYLRASELGHPNAKARLMALGN
jgi:hypothetical protein